MCVRKADISDFDTIFRITQETIRTIYPHYYPTGAVDFFLSHHSAENIVRDIENDLVYMCIDSYMNAVGTVTVRDNELCRLFVLPKHQGNGYGRTLLNFAEEQIAQKYDSIVLDASLPAKSIYLSRGYVITGSHTVAAQNGDFLCYDVMQKSVTDKNSAKPL